LIRCGLLCSNYIEILREVIIPENLEEHFTVETGDFVYLVLPGDNEVRTGGSRMVEIEGGYQVWTKKIGDAPIKVLLLHGGPGLDHTYFECFEDFLPANGIEDCSQWRQFAAKSSSDARPFPWHELVTFHRYAGAANVAPLTPPSTMISVACT
jgi:hypothetical protein